MTRWWLGIPPAEAVVACRGGVHRLRFDEGVLHALDHADVEGERALAALGGARCTCVDLLDAWARRSADPRVLVAASRGPADLLTIGDGSPPTRRVPGRRRLGASAGWASYGQVVLTGGATASTRLARASGATPAARQLDGELGALLALGRGLPDRLVATVVHNLVSADDGVARTRLQLHAALYGRATAALRGWLGEPDRSVDLVLVDDRATRSVRELDDGGIRLELPIAWLGEVWARNLSIVAGRFCLTASTGDGRSMELQVIAPDLGEGERLTLAPSPPP
jgi:hypothetical protein